MTHCLLPNLLGVDGKTSEDTAQASVTASNIRICAVIDVEHQGIGALDQDLVVAVLGLLHVLYRVDAVLGQLGAVLLEAGNLVLNIVLEEVAESLLVAGGKLAQLPLEDLLVEDIMDSNTASL